MGRRLPSPGLPPGAAEPGLQRGITAGGMVIVTIGPTHSVAPERENWEESRHRQLRAAGRYRVEFHILGTFELVPGGETRTVAASGELTVLALLVLNAGRVVPAGALIEAAWGAAARTPRLR